MWFLLGGIVGGVVGWWARLLHDSKLEVERVKAGELTASEAMTVRRRKQEAAAHFGSAPGPDWIYLMEPWPPDWNSFAAIAQRA